jgi:hypothetical protein
MTGKELPGMYRRLAPNMMKLPMWPKTLAWSLRSNTTGSAQSRTTKGRVPRMSKPNA